MGSDHTAWPEGFFFPLIFFSLFKWLIFPAKSLTPFQEEWCLSLWGLAIGVFLLPFPIIFFLLKLPHLQVSAWWYGLRSQGWTAPAPTSLGPPTTHPFPCPPPPETEHLSKLPDDAWPIGRHLLLANVQINTYSCLKVCRENQVWLLITAFGGGWGGGNKWELRPWCRREVFSFGCSIWRLRPKSWRGDLGAESSLFPAQEKDRVFWPCHCTWASESQGYINHLYRHFDSGRGGEEFVP